ncbi:MAG: hypothetical protein ISQ52_10880 [Synechococcus sp. BS307-5m-G38]|nr:hypothetical protein [Synechococcus sp. BS307-5m-G38]
MSVHGQQTWQSRFAAEREGQKSDKALDLLSPSGDSLAHPSAVGGGE